jgi:PfaB family protein
MEKIAIIGLSCLFPDAKNPEEFWQNLVGQKDSTSSATLEEMGIDPAIFYNPVKGDPDKTYSLNGGYIRNFEFNAAEYNLSSELLKSLDNTFKWSLYVAKQAFEDSGYQGNEAVLSRCGVILGNLSLPTKSSNQLFSPIYREAIIPAVRELLQQQNFILGNLPTSADKVSPYNAMISSLPAALIAQAFSLSSINFALDAACSSSLYSVKLASHYLWSHKADLMLAGAISCADPLFLRMVFSGVQGYAENGTSRPLDKSSRGLIPADGIGMVVLKRHSDAIRDGDRIYATICGNGLSNDGRGKYLLSPNSKGQMLAFERAYAEAGIAPATIDYIECHATGTLLGDTTELNSIDTFFGQHQAAPLAGSVKTNVGHLLTAAGMVSMIKVLLSMSKSLLPSTIHITDPLGSQSITPEQIVRKPTAWPKNAPSKRAAVNAFGFGGTNAHLILEQDSSNERTSQRAIKPSAPVQLSPLAIVGMDASFGSCQGLDAFERSIYEGNQHFGPLPPQRWRGIDHQRQLLKDYGLEYGQAPQGAYMESFEFDPLHFKMPPNEIDELNPQQLLLLKVTNEALRDAGIKEGGNVAVIVAAETEFSVHQLQERWNLPWQIKEGLSKEGIALSSEQLAELETIVKNSIHNPVGTSEYLSYIANIMASRISALWDFTGPAFTLAAGENSTFKALEVAQMLLATGEVDAVLVGAVDLAGGVENVLLRNQSAKVNQGVPTLGYDQNTNGWMIGEGAGAVVLKKHEVAKKDSDAIYAVIDAISLVRQTSDPKKLENHPQVPSAELTARACQQALKLANLQPSNIRYIEVYGSGIQQEDEAEIEGLTRAYPASSNGLNCGLGSIKANIGHTYTSSGMASLIKTALCIHHRYIPAVPQWSGSKIRALQDSSFYIASQSSPWCLEPGISKRVAAINGMGIEGTYAHLILSEESKPVNTAEEIGHRDPYLQQMPFHLFPIASDDRAGLLEQIDALQKVVENGSSLNEAASQTFFIFQKYSQATYALVILGRNKDELIRELQRAIQGVALAFERGTDWRTPLGSYFTAKPLGRKGTVAYAYPGAFGSYVGLGRNIFRLFPKIWDNPITRNTSNRLAKIDKLLYPRSLNKLSLRQLEVIEKQLSDNVLSMLETEMGFATLITAVMKDYFQVQPHAAFGYSLGETSMLCAQGVWSNFNEGSHALNSSPLFGTRLSGPKNAVREYWGLPQSDNDQEYEEIWNTHVLMTSASEVMGCLKQERHVYLTQINTPKEVVIAGEPEACQRVIKTLNCDAFRAPLNHAIHCEAMRSEYDELVKLNTLPIRKVPEATIYSAAEYEPLTLDADSVSHHIAKGLCQPLDFPRMVNRIYEDGNRIFIETGAGSICSRWIDEILGQKEHITISLNRRGTDDFTSIVRALAQLISHRVPVDLSSLYQLQQKHDQRRSILKTITLGGSDIRSAILSESNRESFKNLPSRAVSSIDFADSHQPLSEPRKSFMKTAKNRNPVESPISPIHESTLPETTSLKAIYESDLGYAESSLPQEVNISSKQMAKAHHSFLQNRQESLEQIAEIIQLQVNLAKHLLHEMSESENRKH